MKIEERHDGHAVAWPGIDINLCNNCGDCISFCPCNMFEEKEDGSVRHNEKSNCTLGRACKKCLQLCPQGAILLRGNDGRMIELEEEFSCLVFGAELPPGAIDSIND